MKAFFNSLKKGQKDGRTGGTQEGEESVQDSRGSVGTSAPKAEEAPEVYPNSKANDFLARYEVGATVGVGGFAVVKKAKDKETGEQLAVKIVDRSRYSSGDNSLAREIEVLTNIRHPNCIRLFAVYLTERKVYLVTELVEGGELLDRVTERGNFAENDAQFLFRQILEGVAYLHRNGIVHRDLKLENLILLNDKDDSPVKIADFGLSKFFDRETLLQTMCGSPQYVAPEVLSVGSDGVHEYTPAVDMWSLGVILFILLSGYSPFDDDNDAILFEKIKLGKYDDDDPVWDTISSEAKDLTFSLLSVDVSKRPTAQEALGHPWLAGKRTFGEAAKS
uniref:Calcium/calmodulin-dependent protein kinase I n=1 Tax=Tetraselmis sp. GSL018 TaxID=582737 RepID=A0A061RYI3_9CHLO|mmetsp:Transcript_41899/g.99433  ORF Transcript_41899/g.99433 Transcript_41899/m.99433 type:complete len:334 (+) Transcript_41899:192-1193(+)|eukprot:CAMPEP_0177608786 /NCGR_PEP_ID=MMETSP0419_2-20121207/18674_1 /TAXON_ID=582737 /ORGANISM="Tetraselmis sp., Strain GSL018" /LENGTH=333 /DNA_ID=CAMNT_0019103533 /DNA_START=158 /DNA_END=1159 /DNA_ORIENTATION=-